MLENRPPEKTPVELATRLFVVEYSVEQKATNIHTLAQAIKVNIATIKASDPPNYIPIGLFETQAEALLFSQKLLDQSPDLFTDDDDIDDKLVQGELTVNSL